ncbi:MULTISPECIES: acetolactate synthase small subunit [Limnochorda]|uniref:acetolactate synthase small subunit n=1 Tax=Limnochorda TaxID=1676651 RepID=UPI0017A2E473|nr:acetolactate synthase small subunit [Limnochorda pilosa]MBO2486170.1 acetolactate synthase small subunit [Bacillota bacterium]MBO2518546.1 acetolactate synthase small subunit [Bacillota bacterium]NMA70299.1 acetolactate synthase small subunit [Bacillota bacterium]
MKRTLSILVENQSGVLARVAGLFSRRGFNIESLSVAPTEDPTLSRITLVTLVDEKELEQLTKQLHKLVDVVKISDITEDDHIERELALIKVAAQPSNRQEILQVVDIFRARVVDVSERSVVVEVTGDQAKVDAMEQLLRPYGIREMVRTGKVAMVRGARTAPQVVREERAG